MRQRAAVAQEAVEQTEALHLPDELAHLVRLFSGVGLGGEAV